MKKMFVGSLSHNFLSLICKFIEIDVTENILQISYLNF